MENSEPLETSCDNFMRMTEEKEMWYCYICHFVKCSGNKYMILYTIFIVAKNKIYNTFTKSKDILIKRLIAYNKIT